MYASTTGTFLQRDPLGQMGSTELMYSDEYVTQELRNRANDDQTIPDLITLYAYVSNNPINLTDPFGLIGYGGPPGRQIPRRGPPMVCGFYVLLYTGSGCVTQDVYQAALDAAAGVVNCWWDCEVTIHKCAAGLAADAAGAGTTLSFTHLEIGKTAIELAKGLPGQSTVTTLQSRLSYELQKKGYSGAAGLLRRGARQVKANPLGTGVGSAVAGVAIVEAGFSIYCGYKCS